MTIPHQCQYATDPFYICRDKDKKVKWESLGYNCSVTPERGWPICWNHMKEGAESWCFYAKDHRRELEEQAVRTLNE